MPLILIIGPMKSGKTTELLKYRKGKTLIISHVLDTRTTGVKTHDGIEVHAHKCDVLPYELCSQYDTVLVDEIQFFSNLTGIESLAPNVVCAGLNGDFKRRPMGKVLSIVPKASDIIFLTARCDFCGKDAPFTKRMSYEERIISVDSEYKSVCEKCYIS
jgi:thymidine kinase